MCTLQPRLALLRMGFHEASLMVLNGLYGLMLTVVVVYHCRFDVLAYAMRDCFLLCAVVPGMLVGLASPFKTSCYR